MEVRSIEILSDSTGETAERVVRAATLQFPHSGTWPVIDVSGSAIEETAGIILESLKERGARARPPQG